MAAIVSPSSPANRRMIPRLDAPPPAKRFRVAPEGDDHAAAAAGEYNPQNVQRRLAFGAPQHPPAIVGLIQLLQVLVVNDQNQ